jgi:arabinosaccharide transport system substrate-binding protein
MEVLVMRKSVLIAVSMLLVVLMAVPAFAAEKKPSKLVFWSFTPNNFKEVEDRKAEIEKKFGITLEMELLEGDAFMTRLRSAATTGEGWPDIIDGYGDDAVLVANPDPELSLVIPLDDYVKASKIASQIVPARMAKYNFGGHQYGLPNDVHPSVLIYNDEAWKAAGVDMEKIETWDEFFEAGKKVAVDKDGDGKQDVYPMMAAWYSIGQMILQQSGLKLEDKDGIPQINQPDFVAQMDKLYGWYKAGLIIDIDWAAVWDHIAAGRVVALTTPDWWFHGSLAPLTGTAVDGKMRARPLPAWTKGGPRTAAWGGSYKAVSIGCKYPEFAYQVAEDMNYGAGVAGPKYKSSGILMPISSAWDAEEFKMPYPVYGGQQVGLLQIELAKEMPVQEIFLFSAKGWGQINNAWTAATSGEKSVKQALDDAQKALLREIEDYQNQ